jgi:threonine synthase
VREANIVVPKGRVSRAKLAQVMDYGGNLIEVDGSFDDAFAHLKRSASEGAVVMNSVNPYRIEGQKCAAFVMLEQRGWNAPDWVVVPGGNLGNASAIAKGVREAYELRLIDRVPRLAIAQAALGAQTEATAIAVGKPSSRHKATREVEFSGGSFVDVGDDEIADAKALIGREGVGCEPASAAALAGARALRARGTIAPGADVVCVLTGHVLKDADYIERHRLSGAAPAYAASV